MALFHTSGTAATQVAFLEALRNMIVTNLGPAWTIENLAADIAVSGLATQGPISQGPNDLQMTVRLDIAGRVPASCYFSFLTGDGPPSNYSGVNWGEPDFMVLMPHTGYTPNDGGGNGVHLADQPGNPDDEHNVVSLPSVNGEGGGFDYWIWGTDGAGGDGHFIFCAFKIEMIYWQSFFVGSIDMYPGVNGGYYAAGTAREMAERAHYKNPVRATSQQWETGNCLDIHRDGAIQAPILLHNHGASIVPAANNNWTFLFNNADGSGISKNETAAFATFSDQNTGGIPNNFPNYPYAVFGPITKTNQGNAVSPLVCSQIFCPKDEFEATGSRIYGPAGTIPGVFYIDGTHLTAEQTIVVNGDDYFVFPGLNSDVVLASGQDWFHDVYMAVKMP